jgi:hypothetical protein
MRWLDVRYGEKEDRRQWLKLLCLLLFYLSISCPYLNTLRLIVLL